MDGSANKGDQQEGRGPAVGQSVPNQSMQFPMPAGGLGKVEAMVS